MIDIQDLLTAIATYLSKMFYIFLDVKKKKHVECILMEIFNIDISIAAIYDIFDIHELAEFTGCSSFFILLKFVF